MNRWPTVIALWHYMGKPEHDAEMRKGEKRLTALFDKAGKKPGPRKVYIEQFDLNAPWIVRLHGFATPDYHDTSEVNPHSHAAREAERRGWTPVSLDTGRQYHSKLRLPSIPTQEDIRNLELTQRYLNKNLRERHWAQRFRDAFRPEDFIILHPPHVVGFLQETGIPIENVKWIHRPMEREFKRLEGDELAEFQRKRQEARRKRQESIQRQKTRRNEKP